VFLPFGLTINPAVGFAIYLVKVVCIVALLALLRTIMARLRIDQMIQFCWKYLTPLALAQVLINLILKILLFK
jgi:NADH-quinone oxidoreductase subunit H